MKDERFELRSTYGRETVKGQIFCHEDGTVGLMFGFLGSVEVQVNVDHESARKLAESILAIVPEPAIAEPEAA